LKNQGIAFIFGKSKKWTKKYCRERLNFLVRATFNHLRMGTYGITTMQLL
jgi:hypothetical protein